MGNSGGCIHPGKGLLMNGLRKETRKTGWIKRNSGNWSLKATGFIFWVIWKGPRYLWSSLAEGWVDFKF